ncbi:hypothetical protein [uncultured Clostridium sp.]|jgi:hypothetical protein|uniref:hypothetical protein n=1 Tax=uncultured Clostridium sp. TaxID=59620 RepID=UPI00261B31EB|nr:hypothetical protein [uncultured Clostridium sp.]
MLDKRVELYDLFLSYTYKDVMELLRKANSKEEKDFYAKVSDIILQREQERVMGE